MVLTVLLSSSTSPLASTVIFFDRSPLATAVVTSAMLRTWVVRLLASRLTLSVRSFQVPATPGTSACTPSFPSTPTVRATLVTCSAKMPSVLVMLLSVSASAAISPLASTPTSFCDRSPLATAVTTLTMPRTWAVRLVAMKLTLSVRSFQTPLTPLHVGLAAQLPLGADLARDAGDLGREAVELIDHGVDRALELEHLALGVDGDLLRQVAARDGRRHLGDVAHLRGEVVGQLVHVVGQIAPDAGGVRDRGLAAQLAVGADLLGHARDLGGERRQLIDHAVDGRPDAQELALDRLTLNLQRHLLREVAGGDGADDARDLGGRLDQIADERVDRSDAGRPAAALLAQEARSFIRPSRPTTRSTRTIWLANASLRATTALNSRAISPINPPMPSTPPWAPFAFASWRGEIEARRTEKSPWRAARNAARRSPELLVERGRLGPAVPLSARRRTPPAVLGFARTVRRGRSTVALAVDIFHALSPRGLSRPPWPASSATQPLRSKNVAKTQ